MFRQNEKERTMDISLQMYSLREEAKSDFPRALELAAKAGYQGVEFAGYFENSPARIKELLAAHGLKAVSTHAGMPRLKDALDEEIAFAKTLGYSLIVCPKIPCSTKGETIADARFLETCAQKVLAAGLSFGYHNHDHEFKKFDGEYAMDIILKTAPSVKFQPDVFWIAKAGVDPVSYIAPLEKQGRICAVHAKELAKTGDENVYIGTGRIDFAALAKLCSPEKYPWIVEQEFFSGDHFEGISASYTGLRKVFDSLK
jgi:sugar phosphate isomerase/epimerase